MVSLLVTLVVFALLLAGVAGSLVPQLPGAPLSIAGVVLYWWASGYTEPGILLLAALLIVGVLTWIVDWAGGAIAARIGGASTRTAIVAGAVGFLLFFVAGPVGVLAGVAATVFALEYSRHGDASAGAKAAAVTTLGMLASAVVQALLTASILLAMFAVVML